MLRSIALLIVFVASAVHAADPRPVVCDGFYKFHLQGVAIDEKAVYWCFTDTLVKTNLQGKVLKQVPVKNHHGDLCHHDGKLYVAVNFGRFNDAKGLANSWVYVYNTSDLSEAAKHRIPQVFHGAGGVAVHSGRFWVVGGLPEGVQENYVYEYDASFKFVKKHVIKSGYTRLGIQTATFAGGHFWFGCYGSEVLKTDTSFKLLGKYNFECGYGIAAVSDKTFFVARGPNVKGKGRTGNLLVADADDERGLVIRKPAEAKQRSSKQQPKTSAATGERRHTIASNNIDWPQWRGPGATGVADGRNLPVHWSTQENILWSAEIPGWGTSSPAVFGKRVFVTSEVDDAGKKSLLTLCYERTTGRELWRHDFGLGVNQRTHEKSNLATNTPAVTNDAVYVSFGNAEIARYSHAGKLSWVTRYIPMFGDPKMAWGYCLSPVVLDDAVLFPWDHHTGPCFLLGLDKRTGEVAWKKDRPIGTAHATPIVTRHHGQTDLLVPGKHRLTAFDAATRRKLWQYGSGAGPYNGEIISSPVHADGVVYLQLWRKSRIHAIRLNANGKPPTPLWVSDKPGPVEPSLLHYRGHLYALMDNGVLVCLDAKTGRERYRTRLGGDCNSSPIASDGRVYVSNNAGKTFVVQAGPTFRSIATNDLRERITASPAITGDWLIYRTDSNLFCIGRASTPLKKQ